MSVNKRRLVSAARRVVEDCEGRLELAEKTVRETQARREEAEKRLAEARQRERQAEDWFWRVYDKGRGEGTEEEEDARTEMERAGRAVSKATRPLTIGKFEPEYRKAVARQIAGLIREESEERLKIIASRSDDPEVRETVAECREEVARAVRYVLKMFAAARPLRREEVRKARAEAEEILGRV